MRASSSSESTCINICDSKLNYGDIETNTCNFDGMGYFCTPLQYLTSSWSAQYIQPIMESTKVQTPGANRE